MGEALQADDRPNKLIKKARKTPISFLSLPRELRQQVFLFAAKPDNFDIMVEFVGSFMNRELLVAFHSLNQNAEELARIHGLLEVDADYAVKKWAEAILDIEAEDLAKFWKLNGVKEATSEGRLAFYRQAVQEWDEGGREKVLRGTIWAYLK